MPLAEPVPFEILAAVEPHACLAVVPERADHLRPRAAACAWSASASVRGDEQVVDDPLGCPADVGPPVAGLEVPLRTAVLRVRRRERTTAPSRSSSAWVTASSSAIIGTIRCTAAS